HLKQAGIDDPIEVALAHQNDNPIKVVSSGPEGRAGEPFHANGKLREAARVEWWDGYRGPFCVFGHYWRNAPPSYQRGPDLFAGYDLHHCLGAGHAMCIDFAVGARGLVADDADHARLAALRWPERELIFDNGEARRMEVLHHSEHAVQHLNFAP